MIQGIDLGVRKQIHLPPESLSGLIEHLDLVAPRW